MAPCKPACRGPLELWRQDCPSGPRSSSGKVGPKRHAGCDVWQALGAGLALLGGERFPSLARGEGTFVPTWRRKAASDHGASGPSRREAAALRAGIGAGPRPRRPWLCPGSLRSVCEMRRQRWAMLPPPRRAETGPRSCTVSQGQWLHHHPQLCDCDLAPHSPLNVACEFCTGRLCL